MAEPTTPNEWCQTLGITPPKLETVASHRDANTFALLIVALLEHGASLTLDDIATRFEQAGIARRSAALRSLQRCRPGRPPVYRDGDRYHLDPHDDEVDLWVFRLGLRPRDVPPREVVEVVPLPDLDTALSLGELDEAWTNAGLFSWSAQRLAVAVLDAYGGPLPPASVVAAVAERTKHHALSQAAAKFKRRGSAVDVLPDGRWAIAEDAGVTVKQTRATVRDRVALARRHAALWPDSDEIARRRAEWEKKRADHAAELAEMSRALLAAFPTGRPEAVALLDVGEHQLTTFVGDELALLPSRLASYDILGGVDVRGLLRALGFDPGERRLAELGPPQKTKKLNKRGRTLKITTALLIQGSCGISKPFGERTKLAEYLASGELTKLRRRLGADVKSLYALYEYGRLHGAVRLRWGFLDDRLPAPWVHRDEPTLYELARSAHASGSPLEVVTGAAPGWDDPWSRGRLAYVEEEPGAWRTYLVDEDGYVIDEADVQRARLADGPR
ncbi:MAG: hypothetical protein KC619_21595 [Myxococcales bacterium]|nr:hypothetical protein [Myxococcales bacterium]